MRRGAATADEARSRILFIVAYFGRWPEWIELYWASCEANPTIDWLFITDCALPSHHSANLSFESLSYEQYCALVSTRLGVPFHPSDPYKLCDLKPALGYLHEEELRGYDFWGFTDIDIVYGNLRKGLTPEVLRHRVISAHADRIAGHLTLLRNTKRNNRAFMRIPGWRRSLSTEEYRSLDERYFTRLFLVGSGRSFPRRTVDRLKYGLLRRGALFFEAYSTILSSRPWLDGSSDHPLSWHWDRGTLTNSKDSGREFLYLHFMNLKSARYLPRNRGDKAAWEGLCPLVRVEPSEVSASWTIDETGFHSDGAKPARRPAVVTAKASISVSVIVPAYNVLGYIEEAVDSILLQTLPAREILVIDDGSTDGTGELAEQLFGGRESVRIVRAPHRGLGEARNLGASLATQEFIYFFDADDIARPDLLEGFGEALRRQPDLELFCFSGSAFVDESIREDPEARTAEYKRRLSRVCSSGERALVALDAIKAYFAVVWLYILKRDLLARHDLRFRPILHEDTEFTPRLFLVAARTVITDRCYLDHRLRAGSIMHIRKTMDHVNGLLTSIESLDACARARGSRLDTRIFLRRSRRTKLFTVAKYWESAAAGLSRDARSRQWSRMVRLVRKDVLAYLIFFPRLYRLCKDLLHGLRRLKRALRLSASS